MPLRGERGIAKDLSFARLFLGVSSLELSGARGAACFGFVRYGALKHAKGIIFRVIINGIERGRGVLCSRCARALWRGVFGKSPPATPIPHPPKYKVLRALFRPWIGVAGARCVLWALRVALSK